ncbi:MAG: exo-alpha-sialidase [Bacteroidia bacterium]|nr:exo-alpha-sialidase [Bacteroidia bacterium]
MNKKIKYALAFLLIIGEIYSCGYKKGDLVLNSYQYQVPVLVNKENNLLLQMELISSGVRVINKVRISMKGTTDLNDIQTVRLLYSGKKKNFDDGKQFDTDQKPATELVFKGELSVSDTMNLWVTVQLKERADLFHKIAASCEYVSTDQDRVTPDPSFKSKALRIGIALRQHMDDGVNTFRIPGLTTTNNGTLLAIYDVRRDNNRDLQGNIDVGLSRSTDGGNTWEPMRIVLDMGKWGGLPEKFNGVGDANILLDRTNNTIYVAGLWMHGVLDKNGKWIEGLTEESDAWEHQWKDKGSQPGFGVKETSQFLMTKSTDDGIHWSEPVNITHMGKKKEWWLWAPAPGHGITLDDGTLVIPAQGRDEAGLPFSNITLSKDHGQTWYASNPAYQNTTECMAVQLSNGFIMLNMRHNENRNDTTDLNGRAVAITRDLGETWTEHPTSRRALIEPTCMASIHKHEYTENGHKKSILLFSNPNSKKGRQHLTIKLSFDEGLTWPEENWLLLDELKSRGYSCLTSIDENTIGILYEGSQSMMTFEKIPLSELMKK